ncbi:peptide-binding protein [Rhodobacteraceae bacterium CCMM004]|nr:peptide-binding protein [Rhodobacteraceae bacterium CCMM004]
MIRLVAFLVCLAGAAAAQDLKRPALYDVAGVAANDVLNLRAGPSSAEAIVGALPPDARDVEVVAVNDTSKWGLVALPEGGGWASLRYLERQGGQPEGELPLPLRCSGTEPFWSLTVLPRGRAIWSGLDLPTEELRLVWTAPPVGRIAVRHGVRLVSDGAEIAGVVTRERCSDGMSDRPFGLSILATLTRRGDTALYEGCCSVQP